MSIVFSSDCLPLPVVAFSDCNPELNLSEIKYILITRRYAQPLTDWTSRDEWLLRLSPGNTDLESIRSLSVIGDIPEPSLTTQEISGHRTKDVFVQRQINLEIDETNFTNYEFMRQSELELNIRLWFVTRSEHLFGGNDGLIGQLKLHPVYNRGSSEILRFIGTFLWANQLSPERIINPLKDIPINHVTVFTLLSDGQGNFLQDGNGNFITTKL
jgi:hypothetical protein